MRRLYTLTIHVVPALMLTPVYVNLNPVLSAILKIALKLFLRFQRTTVTFIDAIGVLSGLIQSMTFRKVAVLVFKHPEDGVSDNDSAPLDLPLLVPSFEEDLNVLEQARFLLMLREDKQLSQVAISEVISKCRRLCDQTFSSTISRVKGVMLHAGINVDDVVGLSNVMDGSAPDYFDGIDTSYLLEEFARKHMDYIVSQGTQSCFLLVYLESLQASFAAITCTNNNIQILVYCNVLGLV